jgi:hypothetical protein
MKKFWNILQDIYLYMWKLTLFILIKNEQAKNYRKNSFYQK